MAERLRGAATRRPEVVFSLASGAVVWDFWRLTSVEVHGKRQVRRLGPHLPKASSGIDPTERLVQFSGMFTFQISKRVAPVNSFRLEEGETATQPP